MFPGSRPADRSRYLLALAHLQTARSPNESVLSERLRSLLDSDYGLVGRGINPYSRAQELATLSASRPSAAAPSLDRSFFMILAICGRPAFSLLAALSHSGEESQTWVYLQQKEGEGIYEEGRQGKTDGYRDCEG